MIRYPLIQYVSVLSAIIPICVGMWRYKVLSHEMRILLLLLIGGFATDFFSTWPLFGSRVVPWLSQAYTVFEYILVMYIIYSWQEGQRIINFLKVMLWIYILFWICAKFTFEPFNKSEYITASISRVILVLSGGYTLFIVIGERLQPLLHQQRFWILLSFVLFYAGTLMPVAVQGILFSHSRGDLLLAWSITWILSVLSNILFTIGYLCPQTQT